MSVLAQPDTSTQPGADEVTLRAHGVRAGLNGRVVLHDGSLHAQPGHILGLIGPNGSGKTTLLRCCYRSLGIESGSITLNGSDISGLRRKTVARSLAATTQEVSSLGGLSVRESVQLGRASHHGWFEPLGSADHDVVDRVLARVGLTDLANRDVTALSGGERVSIARALAQEPRVLLLDEPTNHLDLRHQLSIMELMRDLAATGLAIVVTLHDLRFAAEYCDQLGVMHEGRIVAEGTPEEVLDEELLARVFGVKGVVRFSGGRRSLEVYGLAEDQP